MTLALLVSLLIGEQTRIVGPAKLVGPETVPVATAAASTSRTFNGSSQQLSNSGTQYLGSAGTFTIAFQIKSASLTQSNTWVLALGNSGELGVLYGYTSSSSKANVDLFNNGVGAGYPATNTSITIPDTTGWHHVAYTYDGTTLLGYLDGTQVISVTASFTLYPSGGTQLYVGAFNAGNYFAGSMARVYMSTGKLSGAQITTLAGSTCSTSGVPAGTVGYWLLGSASPDPESSPSPNTNSLTVTGATIGTGPTCSSQ